MVENLQIFPLKNCQLNQNSEKIMWIIIKNKIPYCIQIHYLIWLAWDIIHLLHAGEGNMKIYSPKSIILSF
jgi:hypothetical protein